MWPTLYFYWTVLLDLQRMDSATNAEKLEKTGMNGCDLNLE